MVDGGVGGHRGGAHDAPRQPAACRASSSRRVPTALVAQVTSGCLVGWNAGQVHGRVGALEDRVEVVAGDVTRPAT